jgi:hypothetical protein
MHFNGQSTTTLDGLRTSAVTDCLVHELSVDEAAHTERVDVDEAEMCDVEKGFDLSAWRTRRRRRRGR